MLNSKIIKQKIVEYIQNNPGCVKNLFSPEDRHLIDETELLKVSIWKRPSKEKFNNEIFRHFSPLNSKQEDLADQINVKIISDNKDENIIKILIEG